MSINNVYSRDKTTHGVSLFLLIRYAVYRVEYSSCVAYRLLDRQDERMDELNLFIDYHTKYTVSII